MTNLTKFLLARIAETKAAAADADRGEWAEFASEDCDAKRRIVEHYQRAVEVVDRDKRRVMAGGYPHPQAAMLSDRDVSTLETVVHLLAAPYADHPDYDPAWRP